MSADDRSTRQKIVLALAATAVIGMVTVWSAYQTDLRSIRARVFAGGLTVRTGAGEIEYGTRGTGAPLLVVHGADGGYDQGLIIAAALVGDRFKAIAPSRFGYLRTPLPGDASAAAQGDAYAALLDVLSVRKTVVVAVSAGAPSAMQLALRHPERVSALILLSPLGYAPGTQAPIPGNPAVVKVIEWGADFIYWTMLHVMPSALTRLWGVPPEVLERAGPEDRAWAANLLRSGLPQSLRMGGVANDAALHASLRFDAWPLERIAVPTLIVTSSDDLFRTQPAAEYAASKIPGATLIVYPTGGHLFVGHAAELRTTIAAFLDAHAPR